MIRHSLFTAAALVFALTPLAAPAGAAPRLVQQRIIASDAEFDSPLVAASSKDEAMVVSGAFVNDPGFRLFSRVRRADGSLAPGQELARDSEFYAPGGLRFNPLGDSLVSWCANTDCTLAKHSIRKAGGLSSAPIAWAPADCAGAVQSVAYGSDGSPVVACSAISGAGPNNNRVVVLSASSIDGLFATKQVLLDGSPDRSIKVAADVGPDGTRAVAWGEKRTSDAVVRVAIAPPGGQFGAAKGLVTLSSSTASIATIDVAVLADGRVVVVQRSSVTTGSPREARAYIVLPGGTVVVSRELSGGPSSDAQVERDGNSALVAWTSRMRDGDDSPSQLTVASVGGTAGAELVGTQILDQRIYELKVGQLSVAPNGAAAIGRLSPNGLGQDTLAAWFRPAGATAFTGPLPIASSKSLSNQFGTAVDRHGSLIAVWIDDRSLVFGGIDVAGPEVSSLKVPSRLRAGAAGSFSVEAIDPAGVRKVTWSFGDGGSAAGRRASHSFRKAGSHRVEVTAVDSAGQESKAARTVSVVR